MVTQMANQRKYLYLVHYSWKIFSFAAHVPIEGISPNLMLDTQQTGRRKVYPLRQSGWNEIELFQNVETGSKKNEEF